MLGAILVVVLSLLNNNLLWLWLLTQGLIASLVCLVVGLLLTTKNIKCKSLTVKL